MIATLAEASLMSREIALIELASVKGRAALRGKPMYRSGEPRVRHSLEQSRRPAERQFRGKKERASSRSGLCRPRRAVVHLMSRQSQHRRSHTPWGNVTGWNGSCQSSTNRPGCALLNPALGRPTIQLPPL
jgi:hypothetical protein